LINLIACRYDIGAVDYINELINDGALLNIKDNYGKTALYYGK
jgi:hypothetical protein